MIKITKTIVDQISSLLSPARSGDASIASQIPQWLAAGDRLVVEGQDLLRISADGVVQRVDGFFNEDGTPAVANLPPELIALLRGESVDPFAQGVQFAQAEATEGQPADTQTDSGETAPVPAVSQVPIASVAQASGQVQVLRNGQERVLLPGDNLYLGDVVITQDQSTVKLNFFSLQNALQAASTAEIGSGTRVSLTGESLTRDGAETLQLNLIVTKGTVDVSQGGNAEIDLRIQTPQGRVEVPQEGLIVNVQEDTGQTSVSRSNAPEGSGSPPTRVSFVNENGQESFITVGDSLTAVVTVPAPDSAQATSASPTVPVLQGDAAPLVDAPANTQSGGTPTVVDPIAVQEEGAGTEEPQLAGAQTQAQTQAAATAEAQTTSALPPQPVANNSEIPSTPPQAAGPAQAATAAVVELTEVADAPAPAPAPAFTPLQASLQAALQARAAAPLTLTETTMSSPVTTVQQDRPLSDMGARAPITGAQTNNSVVPATSTNFGANNPVTVPPATLAPSTPGFTLLAPTLPKAVEELVPAIIPNITLSASASSVDESAGSASFLVTFSSPTSLVVGFTVVVETMRKSDGSVDSRIQATTVSVQVPAGQDSYSFDVPILANLERDDNATVSVRLASPVNALIQGGNATIDLSDNDVMQGGTGNEALTGNNLDEAFNAGDGDDTVNAGEGNDTVDGGAGADSIDAGEGNDSVDGGAGADSIDAGAGNDSVDGGAGADNIDAGAGNDSVDAGEGNDSVDGGGGADTIRTGAGDDSVVFDAADATVIGGSGNDALVMREALTDLSANTPNVSDFEEIDLSTPGANRVILDQAFAQAMAGSSAVVTVTGDADDTLSLVNDDTDNPNAPTWYRDSAADADGLKAYTNGTVSVMVDPDVNVGNDITGTANADTLVSAAGNDTITGGGGNDLLDLTEVYGSGGMSDVTSNLVVDLAQGTTQDPSGLLGSDTLINIDNVATGKGDDSVVGSQAANAITTDLGDDSVGSNDTVDGGGGADIIRTGCG